MDPSVDLIRRDRSFAWYWAGQGVSSLGSQVTVFALPLVTAVVLDGSPGQVGAVAAAGMLPYLLFSLLAGHWLEGRQGRRSMIPANLVQAALVAVIPLASWGGWLSIPLVALVAFVAGTAGLVFGLSAFAYVPSLVHVDQLAAANRAVQGTATVDEIVGPGIAGALVGAVGPAGALIIDAASYLASALGLAKSRPRHAPPPRARVPVLTGMRILFTNVHLRALTIHAAVYNLADQIFLLNLVLWVVQGQGVTAEAYGLALSAAGVGGLIGTVTALRLADRLGIGRAFAVSLGLSCFVPLAVGLLDLEGAALAWCLGALMLVAAVGLGNANVYSLTIRQQIIPPDQLSRSAGAYTQVMYGSIPVGAALAGVIGQYLGTRAGVVIGAVGLALSAAPMLTRTALSLRLPATATATTAIDHHR